jgi:hypothetical protein
MEMRSPLYKFSRVNRPKIRYRPKFLRGRYFSIEPTISTAETRESTWFSATQKTKKLTKRSILSTQSTCGRQRRTVKSRSV